jgi:hypothetical protein
MIFNEYIYECKIEYELKNIISNKIKRKEIEKEDLNDLLKKKFKNK